MNLVEAICIAVLIGLPLGVVVGKYLAWRHCGARECAELTPPRELDEPYPRWWE
ncbi:hypothetical protein ACFSHT_10245 [Paraburkholderia silviterrae]|uniref:hypothetical protein n=1 Tax=Paraburkholderia silviterrae TaxID=2528715 RepID=UPI00196A69B6|nr:hypothetical protein [Paraburkholderia silviterrae]